MSRSRLLVILGLCALAAAGCSMPPSGYRGSETAAPASEAIPQDAGEPNAKLAATATSGAPPSGTAQRRIIYTADLTLSVPDLSAWEAELRNLIKTHGGYVAGSSMGGEPDAPRVGTWELRIPVNRFQPFLTAVQQGAEVRLIKTDSEDVSEEFYDVEARVKNKRVEEQRLVAHLQRSTARLQDILAVEKELSRVREEVERLEGRLRYLSNRTELTTVTLTVSERKGFAPPSSPDLGTQIARTFGESLRQLGLVGRALVLTLVALVPWTLVLAVCFVPVLLLIRRR